ncbi:hypothetical protein G5I_13529 [Acromyrmex echinatior]|uniref:Uncharacterized protein n=1 Tax=Acromyrmex echinatior TaxID=103372 RepID=F4X5A1_ACREC|nr:hypothetical protein G5I_13529 [Acromyrmex echinatior]
MQKPRASGTRPAGTRRPGRYSSGVFRVAAMTRCDESIEQQEELCRAKRPRLSVKHKQSIRSGQGKQVLADKALGRVTVRNSVRSERTAAATFWITMKTKIGMDMKSKKTMRKKTTKKWIIPMAK